MDLRGKSVVIIGGSSGMGFAAAKRARKNEARVTIVGRSKDKLQLADEQLGGVQAFVADIAVESEVQEVFTHLDHVDHVFIPAGQGLFGKIRETDLSILRADVDQRFWGPIYVVRHAVQKMDRGSITFLSGQYASRPQVGVTVTSAMNAALEVLAQGLALELAPIRFNAIAPGLIDTPMLGAHRESAGKWAENTLPVKRMGMAEEVAQAAIFLMTNEFITGEVLHIDGGGRLI